MKKMTLVSLWALMCAVVQLFAQAPTAPPLTTALERVAIFKDGYALFTRRATGQPDADGQLMLSEVPRSISLGSFWAVPKTGVLKSIVAKQWMLLRQNRQETQKALLFQFDPGSASKGVELSLNYFGPGIRWIPAYRVVLDDASADVLMQAEILNEAEDLANTDVQVVVGVPNFQFKDIASPLTFESSLVNPLNAIAPALMGQTQITGQLSNAFTNRAGETVDSRPSVAGGVPEVPSQLLGGEAQDLFVYKMPNMSLRAGERAIVPIASTRVPYKHVYTWEMNLTRSGQDNVPGDKSAVSRLQQSKNLVWHKIELENISEVPWTTGPAFVMDKFLPIAQEILKYTPVHGATRIPLTVATDIQGVFSEAETARERTAIQVDNMTYARISKVGTLKVTNFKSKPVIIELTCELGGSAENASDDGKITHSDFRGDDWTNFQGNPALNGHSTIRWALTLEPRASKELTCEFVYYVK